MTPYEFTCGCGVTFRFECRPVDGGRITPMGCMESFRIPGDVVRMFAKKDGKWVELYCEPQELARGRSHNDLPRIGR